ncbi:MAG: hypothetical protein ACJAXL_001614 [Alphaproteobacteria bacterium]
MEPKSTSAFEIKKLTSELLKRVQETQKELVAMNFA